MKETTMGRPVVIPWDKVALGQWKLSSDAQIASLIGCSVPAVTKRRKQLKEEAVEKGTNPERFTYQRYKHYKMQHIRKTPLAAHTA